MFHYRIIVHFDNVTKFNLYEMHEYIFMTNII